MGESSAHAVVRDSARLAFFWRRQSRAGLQTRGQEGSPALKGREAWCNYTPLRAGHQPPSGKLVATPSGLGVTVRGHQARRWPGPPGLVSPRGVAELSVDRPRG
jgi:hypothetical protein